MPRLCKHIAEGTQEMAVCRKLALDFKSGAVSLGALRKRRQWTIGDALVWHAVYTATVDWPSALEQLHCREGGGCGTLLAI